MKKVRLGRIHADCVTFAQALETVENLVASGQGGYVVTPNVDHVCLAEESEELRASYAEAALSLVDGKPLVWLSHLLGHPLPEKISGSDFVGPLVQRAACHKWRIYFLGGAPGVGQRAADELLARYPGFEIAGVGAPPFGFERERSLRASALDHLSQAKPHLVLVALGCPKQEIFMHRWRKRYAPAVAFGIGAALDFIAGEVKRSPQWMSAAGLEWLFRLSQDPRRLAYRYLVRDRAIGRIAWQMLQTPRQERAFEG